MREISIEKINKCPFCGKTPHYNEELIEISCCCGLSFKSDSKEQVTYNWNYLTSIKQTIEYGIYIENNGDIGGMYHFQGLVDKFLEFKENYKK